ncbi:MAG TPA: hypothetical protein VFE46_02400 [Pirellulales bacterium]|jgi:hypothetical protein|nr:hypothetical protein [Pirellulales bacterium]
MLALLAESILDNHTLVICATVAIICIASEVSVYAVRWRKAELERSSSSSSAMPAN